MTGTDLLRFSAGALRGHRLRSILSLLGVSIGVASVVILTGLGEGARLYVTGEFMSLGANLVIVVPGKTETTGVAPIFGGAPNDLTVDDARALARSIPILRRTAPLSLGTASARFGERSREVRVAGTTSDFLRVRRISVQTGRYLPDDNTDAQKVCVIGPELQKELFPGINPLGEFLRIGENRLRVIGVMAPRGESMGMNLDEVVHVPVVAAMKMFDQSSLFRILAEVGSHEDINAASAAVLDLLVERHGAEDVTVLTQDAVVSSLGSILAVLTAALAGIAAISLSVAGIGIMNVMLVSVSERTSEIGLLKALGVTRAQVLSVFLVEAAILSSAGGLLGLGLGHLGNTVLRGLYPAFPVESPDWAVAGALAISVAVGVLFGAMPARRAARLDPVIALARH